MDNTRTLYIVTSTRLVIGKARFHNELAERNNIELSSVLGGGDYDYKVSEGIMTLSGKSHQFGEADNEIIQSHIDSGMVFGDSRNISTRVNVILKHKE